MARRSVGFISESLCAAVLIAVLLSPVVGQKTTGDVIYAYFDWPAGLEAKVTHFRSQVRESGETSDSSLTGASYRMFVDKHPSGLIVGFDDFALLGAPGGLAPTDLMEQLGAFSPRLVIDEFGALLDVKDLDQVVNQINELLQPMLDSLPAEAAGISEMLARMLSREVLVAKVAEEWNALVGTWIEAEFELNAVYESEVNEPVPLFPGRLVPFLYQFWWSERKACGPAAPDLECVVLEMNSFPDPGIMTELLQEMMDNAMSGADAPGFSYESWNVENYVRLLAEPDGLIPHHLEITQAVSGGVVVQGEGTTQFRQIRSRTWEYSYKR